MLQPPVCEMNSAPNRRLPSVGRANRYFSTYTWAVQNHCSELLRQNMCNCVFRQLRGRGQRVVGRGSKGVGVEGAYRYPSKTCSSSCKSRNVIVQGTPLPPGVPPTRDTQSGVGCYLTKVCGVYPRHWSTWTVNKRRKLGYYPWPTSNALRLSQPSQSPTLALGSAFLVISYIP